VSPWVRIRSGCAVEIVVYGLIETFMNLILGLVSCVLSRLKGGQGSVYRDIERGGKFKMKEEDWIVGKSHVGKDCAG